MLRITPWVILALSHFAQAQPDLLHARNKSEECCPCSNSGVAESNPKTITVTESAEIPHTVTINAPSYNSPSEETITVYRTVTVLGSTIHVTHVEEQTVTKEVTVVPVASNKPNGKYDKTATITSHPISPSGQVRKENGAQITNTVSVEGSNPTQYNKYATVTVGDGEDDQVKTSTMDDPNGSNAVKKLAASDPKDDYETKTIHEGDGHYTIVFKPASTPQAIQEVKDYAVVVKPEPSTETIVLNDGEKATQVIKVPHTITVISPQTVTQKAQEYQTITNTTTHHDGQGDIETIVISKKTGKSTCKRESGLPCQGSGSYGVVDSSKNQSGNKFGVDGGGGKKHGHVDNAEEQKNSQKYDAIKNGGGLEHFVTATEAGAAKHTQCPLMAISTNVQTVYNTVVMTVGPNGGKAPKPTQTATTPAAAQPTGGRKMRIRRSGAHLPAWW